eukprot:TRINITY_DN111039_c0_g1_i1.p1 TRINITY_DN111039_c0_g1~~TRINITY_DN111039_c0_g1_i1.p1  ORF type:complete len:536 (+),score=100.42 TRINITY_DN111039_c0_g1_i1:31-1608(+)
MAEQSDRVITAAELAGHCSSDACWFAIHGIVYDVTTFLAAHPGGKQVLLRIAGEDGTEAFELAHSDETLKMATRYRIGVLQDGSHIPPVTDNGTIMENLSSAARFHSAVKQCSAPELRRLNSLADFEREYSCRAPPSLALHVAYGAEDDETSMQNPRAWGQFRLRPRMLRDTSSVDLSSNILGRYVSFPVGISPFACAKASHPDGELALVRAARNVGCCFCIPQFGNTPLDEIAKEALAGSSSPGNGEAAPPLLLQLYLQQLPGAGSQKQQLDRATAERHLAYAAACGCVGVVITVDTTMDGNREKTYQSESWMKAVQQEMGGLPQVCTMKGASSGPFAGHVRSMTWDDIAWLCKAAAGMPIFLKGIISPEDAARCCDPHLGLSGIFVSNHGGRQLDACEATADVLEEICDIVAGRLPVYVDGGIRRGKDIFRALALGASAVFVGRPAHWGLGVGGQVGVERVLEILKDELQRVMVLSGCASISDISRSHVRHVADRDFAPLRCTHSASSMSSSVGCAPTSCLLL